MKNFVLVFLLSLYVLTFVVRLSFARESVDNSQVFVRNYSEISKEINDNLVQFFNDQGRKVVIYIWDFENRTKYNVDLRKLKEDISTLLLENKRFKLVEDISVKLALKELNLSATGFVDQNYIKEFGKRIGADYILYGAVNNNPIVEGKPNISLSLKLIKIETAEIVWSYEVGLSRRDFKTSLDSVIEEGIFRNQRSLLREWESINRDAIESYGRPIKTISVFSFRTDKGIEEDSVVDKVTSALVQAKIPGVKVLDRNNLSTLVEMIKKEGYDEEGFYKTKKDFGKFYGVDAFLYGYVARNPSTGKVELNLKLAMVESGTVDWGNKFYSYQTSAEFSESVSRTAGAFVGAVGETLGFILSSPGLGINVSFGWLGGFTTPGMTSKDRYVGYDLFDGQAQVISGNLTIEFFRLRLWKHLYFEAGLKIWGGQYTTPDESEYTGEPFLTSATFSGFTPSLSLRYIFKEKNYESISVRVGVLPLVSANSISSKVEGIFSSYDSYGYYQNFKFSFEEKVGEVGNVLNWPFEVEIGMGEDSYLSLLFGIWFPPEGHNEYSKFEWELGFNLRVPIFWWHPFSFLYDKYLWE